MQFDYEVKKNTRTPYKYIHINFNSRHIHKRCVSLLNESRSFLNKKKLFYEIIINIKQIQKKSLMNSSHIKNDIYHC